MPIKTPVKWKEKTLGEVCKKITDGSHNPPKSIAHSQYMMLSSKNVFNDYISFDGPRYISKTDFESENKRTDVNEGDVLITIVGTIGRTAVVPKNIKFTLQRSVAVLKINNKETNSRFIMYLLMNGFELISSQARGVAQKGIYLQSLRNLKFRFPNIDEQQRIVEILDKAFEDIDKLTQNAKQNLQNAKDLFDSYLNSIFDRNSILGDEKTLGEISQVKGGKRVPKGYKLQQSPTSYPYIRVTDFNNYGSVDLDDIHYISEEVFEQIKNYTISDKDLYISIAGTIGKSGIVPKKLDGANLTENACKLVFKANIYNKFIYYFTKTQSFTEQAFGKTRTAAMPKLALTRLATIVLPIPSLIKQQEIVKNLDELQDETKQLEQIYQQKIEQAEELKQSILQKAFNGEL